MRWLSNRPYHSTRDSGTCWGERCATCKGYFFIQPRTAVHNQHHVPLFYLFIRWRQACTLQLGDTLTERHRWRRAWGIGRLCVINGLLLLLLVEYVKTPAEQGSAAARTSKGVRQRSTRWNAQTIGAEYCFCGAQSLRMECSASTRIRALYQCGWWAVHSTLLGGAHQTTF